MLKTSPVLVCYAMLLLLAQYIYGMDLNESELPSNITVSFDSDTIGNGCGVAYGPIFVFDCFVFDFHLARWVSSAAVYNETHYVLC